MMKRIQCLKDFECIEGKYPNEFVEYLKSEFHGLYEYLSNSEKESDFLLPSYQTMIILEELKEKNEILKNNIGVEFQEEVIIKNLSVLRIGINLEFDIQLYYYIKER